MRAWVILSAIAIAMLAAAPAAVGATPRLYSSSGPKYKPASYRGFNHSSFSSMKWSRWNNRKAVARATVKYEYPAAEPGSAEVTVTFSRPKRVCGRRYYTSARWRVPGDAHSTMATLMEVSDFCTWSGA